jgi:predicted DCC family thiol-disulfide oxidoreductase YuxK
MTLKLLLIYDGDCQFCQLSLDFGIRTLKKFPEYVAYQRIDPTEFGLLASDVQSQIWLVSKNTKPLGAHLAAAAILGMQSGIGWRAMGWLMKNPPTSWIAKKMYFFIAANRHRLPGGSRQCNLKDTYGGA